MKVDLSEIVKRTYRFSLNNQCLKFREAAKIYAESLGSEEEKKNILKHTDALLFKFTVAIISLEFLWEIRDHKQGVHKAAIEDEFYEWNNASSILDSLFFESTVIQIRAFLDFAHGLTLAVLGVDKRPIGTKEFYKAIDRINTEKSNKISQKFRQIDSPGSWGEVIRSLRDKIVHRDIIKTNHDFRPTVGGKNYERLGQEMGEAMFELLTDLSGLLFGVMWVAGPIEELRDFHAK